METMKSRSVSPFSKNKAKSHLSNASGNESMVIEQIKAKKKGLKNKCKSHHNGKEKENIANNGKDYSDVEKATLYEMGDNTDSSNTEHENEIKNGDNIENRNGEEKIEEELESNKKTDALINIYDIGEENVFAESSSKVTEKGSTEENENIKSIIVENTEEESSKQNSKAEAPETEIVKNDNLTEFDLLPDSNTSHEKSIEKFKEANDTFNKDDNVSLELETISRNSDTIESYQAGINISDVCSLRNEVNVTDHIQASPDTATKDDSFFSNKISNFFGKLSYTNEQKQDSEVSSSRKIERALNHPYLSKVSGRRGIKDQLNSSATIFCSKEMELKTPENSGISLDDSFRVRTNPPRLNSLDMEENPTLRKFKGKRCLIAGDEPEEEKDMYFGTMKRRKLDEKPQESGLWRSIIWSPFKKKLFVDENQLKFASRESKLSRFLSPFWFWKKTAAGLNGK